MTSCWNGGTAHLGPVLLVTLLCSMTVSPSSLLLPPSLSPAATVEPSEPQSALQRLGLVQPRVWTRTGRHPDPERVLLEAGQEGVLQRAQRRDPMAVPLSPFPDSHSAENIFYQDRGEGEEDGRRSEALTSIIGGLQAVNREKGGFGFRFGRKRWTDQEWGDERRSSTEEEQEEEEERR